MCGGLSAVSLRPQISRKIRKESKLGRSGSFLLTLQVQSRHYLREATLHNSSKNEAAEAIALWLRITHCAK
jgi:hypothetical protein